jgi:hypothetical protein
MVTGNDFFHLAVPVMISLDLLVVKNVIKNKVGKSERVSRERDNKKCSNTKLSDKFLN